MTFSVQLHQCLQKNKPIMARKDLFIVSGAALLLSILIQLFKLILKFDISFLDTLSLAALVIGVGFLLLALLKRKKK